MDSRQKRMDRTWSFVYTNSFIEGKKQAKEDLNMMEAFLKEILSMENFVEKENTILQNLENFIKVIFQIIKCMVQV